MHLQTYSLTAEGLSLVEAQTTMSNLVLVGLRGMGSVVETEMRMKGHVPSSPLI